MIRCVWRRKRANFSATPLSRPMPNSVACDTLLADVSNEYLKPLIDQLVRTFRSHFCRVMVSNAWRTRIAGVTMTTIEMRTRPRTRDQNSYSLTTFSFSLVGKVISQSQVRVKSKTHKNLIRNKNRRNNEIKSTAMPMAAFVIAARRVRNGRGKNRAEPQKQTD